MVLLCQNICGTFRQEAPLEVPAALGPLCGGGLRERAQEQRRGTPPRQHQRSPVRRHSARHGREPEGKIVGRRVDGTPRGGTWVAVNGQPLSPRPSQQVVNHSPDGFDWGYGGAGPAQLALAIALLFCRPSTAVRLYQEFKWHFIATCPSDGFELDTAVAHAWFLRQTFHLAA
jgi:hypothetical protein